MKIKNEDFFVYSDTSKTIEGCWKTTNVKGSVKISCEVEDDHKIHITLITQTLGQRILSGIAEFFTFGCIKHLFRSSTSIIRECNVDFEEVKNTVALCYCEIIASKTADHNINRLSSEVFTCLSSRKPSVSPNLNFQGDALITSLQATSALAPEQVILADKLKQSTVVVVKNVLMFFMNPKVRTMTPFELKEVLEVAQEQYHFQMNERAEKFFRKMMPAIDLMLDGMKGMPEAFEALARTAEDPGIRRKLVEGIAFPFFNNLLQELDRESASIVDQIVYGSSS